jgi:hypothetical protein
MADRFMISHIGRLLGKLSGSISDDDETITQNPRKLGHGNSSGNRSSNHHDLIFLGFE